VYTSPTLNEYVEVSAHDILDTVPISSDQPLAGTVVWVKREAQLERTTVSPLGAQGEFLGGGITDELLPGIGVENLMASPELIGTILRTIRRLVCTRRTAYTGFCCPGTGPTVYPTARRCCTLPLTLRC
jgi:hypothetical protein